MRQYTFEEREQYKKELREKMTGYVEELAQSWTADPQSLAEYLAFASRFPQYSPRNTMLIYQQNPYATFVASYGWFAKQGYRVRKGQRGMRIFAPYITTFFRTRPDASWKRLSDANEDERAMVKAGACETYDKVSFRPGVVFDLAQTDCPAQDYPQLVGLGYRSEQHDRVYQEVKAYLRTQGITVREVDIPTSSLRGTDDSKAHEIRINQLLADTQKLSTLLHEAAHDFLDHGSQESTREQKEFEADALSVMFTAAFGLEVTDARREHLADCYQAYQKQWAKEEKAADKLKDVFQMYEKHIGPMKAAVDQILNPPQQAAKLTHATPAATKHPQRISPPFENYRLLNERFRAVIAGETDRARYRTPSGSLCLRWLPDGLLSIINPAAPDQEFVLQVNPKARLVYPRLVRKDGQEMYISPDREGDAQRRQVNETLMLWLQKIPVRECVLENGGPVPDAREKQRTKKEPCPSI